VRDEIRKSFDLSPGADVEIKGINGAVSNRNQRREDAEFTSCARQGPGLFEQTQIVIDATATSLTIRSEKGDVGFLDHAVWIEPSEKITLKLPKQIHLATRE